MSLPGLGRSQFGSIDSGVQRSIDSLRSALGLESASPVGGSSTNVDYPGRTGFSASSFFQPTQIKGDRWNQLFPYRLLVVDVNNGNSVVSTAGVAQTVETNAAAGQARILFQSLGNRWEYQLPITPQQLQISTAFASSVTSTLRGIVEEHNGVKFKMINCSGTFGVWSFKPTKAAIPGSPNSLQTLFAGTLQGIEDTLDQVSGAIRSITSNHPAAKPTVVKPEQNTDAGGYAGTGYAQALLLDQFLEQYAEAKKNPKNAGWRLVFDVPKQNRAFFVTPVQFNWAQSVENPNEIRYQFQLKAWRKVDLSSKQLITNPSIPPLDANFLQSVIRATEFARRTMGSALNLVKAVRSDFRTPFEVFRQVSLFTKDLLGVGAAVADLPSQIISDAKSSIKDSLKLLDQNSAGAAPGSSSAIVFQSSKYKKALSNITSAGLSQEGLSDSAVEAGQLGAGYAQFQLTDPTNEIFSSPEENFDLFNAINVSDLSLSPQVQDTINTQLDAVSLTTVDDLIQYKDTLTELATQISNAFGAGDVVYSNLYDKPDPYQRVQEMTIDEFSILGSLYDLIQKLDTLTATQQVDDDKVQSALDFVGQLAEEANIPFDAPTAKIRVPVPFGLTIEQIAARYTGNPDKWLEIVTLNSLKEPYIDETGFTYSLLSNADGRQLNVSTNENLYVGQRISVQSNNQPPTSRRIIDIERINDTNYLITLDGLDNLDIYTTTAQARIRAYLPGTTNSQSQIFVPVEGDVPEDVRSRQVPAFASDPLVGLSKVDLLLTEDGDIAVNSFGEFRLAGGLTNLIQALKLKFVTQTGKLIKHPEYGAGIQPGTSSADINASGIVDQIFKAVQEDPRFESLERMEVRLDGPALEISMSVRIASGNGILPITFRAA